MLLVLRSVPTTITTYIQSEDSEKRRPKAVVQLDILTRGTSGTKKRSMLRQLSTFPNAGGFQGQMSRALEASKLYSVVLLEYIADLNFSRQDWLHLKIPVIIERDLAFVDQTAFFGSSPFRISPM